ncbi:MAG: hypothetical protein IKA99_03120 [Clostridia bacterium]|nr:hypothetical protein [Clostridia bacterium]
MKKFRFCYSPLVWCLLVLVIGLSIAGSIKSVLTLLAKINGGSSSLVGDILLIVINVTLLVFSVSVSVFGNYIIKGNTLYSYFGFIRTKSDVNDVVQITLFKKSNKLVVYFKDAKYSVIVISEKFYEPFILALREVNKSIIYTSEIDGEDEPKKF